MINLKTKIVLILFMLLGITALTGNVSAAPRDILKQKLFFYYSANPNSGAAPILLNNNNISAGRETGTFWKNTSIKGLQKLVRALLRDSKNGGDNSLQYYAAKVIQLENKRVAVYLLDDVSQILTNAAKRNSRFSVCKDKPKATRFRSWPCANRFTTRSTYAGWMSLGAHYFRSIAGNNPGTTKLKAVFGTFLHEAVHTQDKSDGRAHLFWPRSGYGMDRTHYSLEVMPNTAASYQEGIANTIRLMYDGSMSLKFFNNLTGAKSILFVEKDFPSIRLGLSRDNWLYLQLMLAKIPEATLTAAEKEKISNKFLKAYAPFRIRTLPNKFIIKNEYIIALILSEYSNHVDPVRFYNAVRVVNKKKTKGASAVAILFEEMSKAGLPIGCSAKNLLIMSCKEKNKSYLLPLAFADYFTHYNARTKDQFSEIFEKKLPQAWIDLYWKVVSKVRQAAKINNTRKQKFTDLTNIASALGMKHYIQDISTDYNTDTETVAVASTSDEVSTDQAKYESYESAQCIDASDDYIVKLNSLSSSKEDLDDELYLKTGVPKEVYQELGLAGQIAEKFLMLNYRKGRIGFKSGKLEGGGLVCTSFAKIFGALWFEGDPLKQIRVRGESPAPLYAEKYGGALVNNKRIRFRKLLSVLDENHLYSTVSYIKGTEDRQHIFFLAYSNYFSDWVTIESTGWALKKGGKGPGPGIYKLDRVSRKNREFRAWDWGQMKDRNLNLEQWTFN